jgi:hypothetical protein
MARIGGSGAWLVKICRQVTIEAPALRQTALTRPRSASPRDDALDTDAASLR